MLFEITFINKTESSFVSILCSHLRCGDSNQVISHVEEPCHTSLSSRIKMWLHDGSSKYVCTYSASQQNFLAVVVGFSNHHDVYIFVQKIDWAYIQKVRYKVGKGGKKPNKDFGTNKLRSAKVFLLLEMKNLKQH